MKKVAVLLDVFEDGAKVETIMSVTCLDVEWMRKKYGSLRSGIEHLYSKCQNYEVVNFWIIDSVRINFDF